MKACFVAVEADIEFLSAFPYFYEFKARQFSNKTRNDYGFPVLTWLHFMNTEKGNVNFD